MTVCDVVFHPERKISDRFAGFGFKPVFVSVPSELDVECILVLLRDTGGWNAVANGRDAFTSGGVDITCGDGSVRMTNESGVNDHLEKNCHRVEQQVIECRRSIQG